MMGVSERNGRCELMSLIDLERPVHDPKSGTRHTHLIWARTVARSVRERYGFGRGSQEEQDLEQTAALVLTAKLADFDPGRVPPGGNPDLLFRGWVQPSIKCQCGREAVRLRNAGTFHTSRNPPGPATDLPEELMDERPSAVIEIGDVRCRLSGLALTVESEPDLDEWARAVGALDTQRERSTWHLGDLAVYGFEAFGDDYAWAQLGSHGYATETVRKARRVSASFPDGIRIPQATWSHHVIVCGLEPSRALTLLRRAVREKLSRRQLNALVNPPRVRADILTRNERSRLPAVAARHGVTEEWLLSILRDLKAVA